MTNETSAIPETDGGATTLNTIVTSLPGQVEESVILNAARTMKVLVVDDSRTLRRLLVRELNIIGITNITEAGDGEEALVKARAERFDLMLCDMEMPNLDGMGTLNALKTDDDLRYLPVIIVSGTETFEKTVKCIEMGAEDYLPKPFNPTLLRARVYSSLEKKRLRDLDKERLDQILHEKEKTEKLMLNILPKSIADKLMEKEQVIAGFYPSTTILFSDLVSFTAMSAKMSADDLVGLLNDLYTRFDIRSERLGVEKIKTIGDAYMAATGVPFERDDHADVMADMAIGMFEDLLAFNKENNLRMGMRVGMHSGPITAGVIGKTKFCFDLWGNSVNTASRMESTCIPGRIQVSPSTFEALNGRFELEEREIIECKGLGGVLTHFLNGRL
jgi:class 3 adenylate cyclase